MSQHDGDFQKDWDFQARFLEHQKEISSKALRVEVAPIEADLKHNTDLVLRWVTPTKDGRHPQISARVRRRNYVSRFRDQFTIRDRRPSGAVTEMHKMRLGDGDFFVYGFESAECADYQCGHDMGQCRMDPWFIGNLQLLRNYDADGGYHKVERNKGPHGSQLAIFHLADMPLGFNIDSSESLPIWNDKRIWEECRNCWWWKGKGGLASPTPHAPVNAHVVPAQLAGPELGDGYGRFCLACRFWWRSGWVMKLTEERAS